MVLRCHVVEADMNDALNAVDRAAEANRRFRPIEIGAGVVSRPAGSSTETVHSFLRHLRSKALECVPEPVGIEGGVERLRFIEGADGGDGWYHQHTEQGLVSAARLLRTIHDAASDWIPPEPAIWGAPAVPGENSVYCHGDPGPWNFVWRDNEAVALIDWDYLHPAPRVDDVAYALRWFAPLRDDEHALQWHHFPRVPNRRDRVHAFMDAYGGLPDFDVITAVTQRIRATMDHVRELAEHGVEPQRTWVADGELEREAAEIAWIERHRRELT